MFQYSQDYMIRPCLKKTKLNQPIYLHSKQTYETIKNEWIKMDNILNISVIDTSLTSSDTRIISLGENIKLVLRMHPLF